MASDTIFNNILVISYAWWSVLLFDYVHMNEFFFFYKKLHWFETVHEPGELCSL